jgi:hypothetical protein
MAVVSTETGVTVAERLLCDGISTSFARLPPGEFDQAVRLLADPRRSLTLIGGHSRDETQAGR